MQFIMAAILDIELRWTRPIYYASNMNRENVQSIEV